MKMTCISSISKKSDAASALAGSAVRATLTAALLATIAWPVIAADETSPEDMIRNTAGEVIDVLRDESLSFEQKATRLETFLDDCCDFAATSKLVLAQNWRKLTADQHTEFTALFKRYLIVTYRDNLNSYGGQTVEIFNGREEKYGDYTVLTKIRGGDVDSVAVNYRLRKGADGKWRIIDVVAEGISLVSNLRSQFREVVSAKGTDGLFEALREKIDEG